MKIFVTGATGFVGSAIIPELIRAGHHVVGLARSEAAVQKIADMGAKALAGHLEDPDCLKRGASDADGVIHTGFIHDFTEYEKNCEIDRRAIEAMGAALAGSNRPFIVTSATSIMPEDRLVTENDMPPVQSPIPRVATEQAVDSVVTGGTRVAVVRLPLTVHGNGDRSFIPALIRLARVKGVSVYSGEGVNIWPTVHRLDAAQVFCLAIENDFLPGTRFHAVAESVQFRQIAETIGKRLGLPVKGVFAQEVQRHFGWLAPFAAMNNPSSSAKTQEALQWHPVQISLNDDLEQEHYYE